LQRTAGGKGRPEGGALPGGERQRDWTQLAAELQELYGCELRVLDTGAERAHRLPSRGRADCKQAYAESSSLTLRKQRAHIDQLKKDNDGLKHELALEMPSPALLLALAEALVEQSEGGPILVVGCAGSGKGKVLEALATAGGLRILTQALVL
jgi:hypothetical protein